MKTLFLFICLIQTIIVSAQFSDSKPITTTADGVRWVANADIDGDGYQDIITANRFGSDVSWYKNNESISFNEIQIGVLNQTSMVATGDLDGDGDVDIIASSIPDHLIVWYENLDGEGNFGSRIIISNTALSPFFFLLIEDIDADGDLDIMSSGDASRIEWYENLDSQATFGSAIIIDSTISSSRSLIMEDIDSDGDLDLVSDSTGKVNIYWLENNDGFGNFGIKNAIGGNGLAASRIRAADFDGDGDIDILGVYLALDKFVWYENIDGLGNFGDEKIISSTDNPSGVALADFDNDNDVDILTSSVNSPTLKWYENLNGLGSFGDQQEIETEFAGSKCLAVDIDNDGDIDAVRASQNDDTIVWYENLLILNNPEKQLNTIKIHPNPADTALFIKSGDSDTLAQMNVTSILGNNIWHSKTFQHKIDIENWASSIYFLEIKNNTGQKKVFKIVKK
ncbi:T9SS type A sorting domain-containing protein [Patiriisocius marinus]|uniref:T9SS type A sorting domain-containing protein n=1 Tax=Patiriisocius marinus TaxID=1397112 RepID=UPI002330DE81|nr:T9SS type A sorting domain-containing protein [Patiriisocius marinus]